ncbi:hypothetical protein N0V83_008924 [Neocucurbitaria cava]|uniref:RCHY1 zinc-ribbon domain-containing protein n=1 Tax=Neocucurbitaria cava TaxID=798079 RepID=A0A9W8Y2D6_9PLEO|nr:hypothetical protein N0V83_008924 [Neocucurbitaria cava]
MSLLSSFIIDPVVRHARRFSGQPPAEASNDGAPAILLTCDPPGCPNDPPPSGTGTPTSTPRDEESSETIAGGPTALIDRFRRYSSFTQRPRSAVIDEQEHNAVPSNSSTTVPINIPTEMSSNPSRAVANQFRRLNLDSPVSSAPVTPSLPGTGLPAGQYAGAMSESLPADDGMAHLRMRIHQIRDLKISDQERARMIHGLMTERYNLMRPTSPSSFVSHDRPYTPTSGQSVFSEIQASSPYSSASDVDPENPYNLREGDTNPSYRPNNHSAEHGDEEEEESTEGELVLGCQHYKRNVKGCYNLYMETAYKCPICKKSAVCMDLQWQKLTQAIESQPMPEQFSNTRAIVQCNDCSAKSSVKYHWLGNQCGTCDSYNTNELRILNGPESEETANAILDADAILEADANAGSTSPVSVSSPASQAPLRSPRYYFQPDEPEETWLPGQLPSFPFQMPQFPGRPRMPQMPSMPQMPQFPTLPQFPPLPNFPQIPQFPQMPQMPQMPDAAQQMLERFRRSFDAYLNPTGDVRVEDVPFIDLGDDDRRERQATDGTTVKEPSLPQYVLERFTQSLARFRNDLNPALAEDIPALDLAEDLDPEGLQFWGEDGGRLDRLVAGDNRDDEDEDSSSDESEQEEEEEDDEEEDEADNRKRGKEFDIPGHR